MNKEEKEIVKYDDKWWVLEKVSDNNMATIWRNGQPATVPMNEIVRKNK